jgi:hypothetical protein
LERVANNIMNALTLVCALLAWSLVACDIDGETMSIQLVNDTSHGVDFIQCGNDSCTKTDPGGRSGESIRPGDHFTTIAVIDVVSWYLVKDMTHAPVGCLRIDFHQRQANPRLFASQTVSCSGG